MSNNLPIGLFDSGVGGTSIWQEINKLLPGEDTIYLADSKNAPYGEKSTDEIIALSIKNTKFLLEKNCKIIVVACNTATTNAITELRSSFDVPFIGIEPALKPAVRNSQTKKVGVLATKGTLSSALFHEAVKTYRDIDIIEQVGRGLVTLIEQGKIDSIQMDELLQKYLSPMIEADIDYLVLGCSHYPYLIPKIRKILPAHVQIIDSGIAVARQTKLVLEQRKALSSAQSGTHLFITNSDKLILSKILNHERSVIELDF